MLKNLFKLFIVIIVLVVFGVILYFNISNSNDVFYISKYGLYKEYSGVMEPEIYNNELVIIKDINEYDINDIIVYKNYNNDLLIRKIVQIDEYGFIAKAENKKWPEPSEPIDRIVGKVIFHSNILSQILKR